MITGQPIKIMLVDDTAQADDVLRYLRRKGYEVELTAPGWAISEILRFWPDLIAIRTPGTSIKDTCQDNVYLSKKKVILCYD